MNRLAATLSAVVLGGLLMYWLDPASGRRRRARLADRVGSAAHAGERFARLAVRDARQRSAGLVAGLHARLRDDDSTDATTLTARVRAQVGRLVAHPHAVRVATHGARVTLSGPVLSGEAPALLDGVRAVAGVEAVIDELTRHDSSEHVSALQGGSPRRGPARWEFLQQNWSPSARAVAATAGMLLLMRALRRSGPMAWFTAAVGAGAVLRSVTNTRLAALLGVDGAGVRVEKTIHIHAPVTRVFEFWSRVEDFPRFMQHVQQVSGDAAGATHWRAVGLGGATVEWDAHCTAFEDNERIAWETAPEAAVPHTGEVRFEDCSDGTTRVHVHMHYQPPAGLLGDRLLWLAGQDLKRWLDDDLMRAKAFLETGHAAHDAAARAPQRGARQPLPI